MFTILGYSITNFPSQYLPLPKISQKFTQNMYVELSRWQNIKQSNCGTYNLFRESTELSNQAYIIIIINTSLYEKTAPDSCVGH